MNALLIGTGLILHWLIEVLWLMFLYDLTWKFCVWVHPHISNGINKVKRVTKKVTNRIAKWIKDRREHIFEGEYTVIC